jgi:O-antigen ligase
MNAQMIYAALLALNLAGFPLVAGVSNVFGALSTPYSVAMRATMLCLSGLLIFLAAKRKYTGYVKGMFWFPFLFFWSAYIMRLAYDTSYKAHWLSKNPQEYWIWAIGACLIPSLALLAKMRRGAFQYAYRWAFVCLLLAALLISFSGGTEYVTDRGISYDMGRLHIASLNPIFLGHLGLSLILVAIWPVLWQVNNCSWRRRVLVAICSALGLYLLVSAASRGPIVAMIVVFCFYFLSVKTRKALKPIVLAMLVFGLAWTLAVRFEETGQYRLLTRIENTFHGKDLAVTGRQDSFGGAAKQFLESPIVGDALEEKATRFYPHNVVLESFMATGFAGGLAFLAILIFGLISAYKLLKWRTVDGWVALIFVQYLIAAQFSGAIYNATIMWTFMSSTIALYCQAKTSRRIERRTTTNEGKEL